MNTIRNANRVYINGVEVGAAGNPSTNQEEYRYDFKKHAVFADSVNKQIELVVLVANYEYAHGGIVTPLIFGTKEQITMKQDIGKLIDIALISGYILFAVIYFITYFQRKKYTYELFFSFFCLFQGLYNSTVNERWLFLLFPHITAKVQVDIQMALISLSMLFFILFGICNPALNIFKVVPLKDVQLLISCTLGISYLYFLIMLITVDEYRLKQVSFRTF